VGVVLFVGAGFLAEGLALVQDPQRLLGKRTPLAGSGGVACVAVGKPGDGHLNQPGSTFWRPNGMAVSGRRPLAARRSALRAATAVGAVAALAAGCQHGSAPVSNGSRAAAASAEATSAAPAPTGSGAAGSSQAGFEPAAVSFVSASRGWVLGLSGCADCAALRETRDGGGIWTALPPPPAPLGYDIGSPVTGVTQVAFADAASGFLYGPELLATTDGGRTWDRASLPPVQDLVIGDGYAYALTAAAAGAPDLLWRTAIGSGIWARLPVPSRPHSGNPSLIYASGSTLALLQEGSTGPAPVSTAVTAGYLWLSTDHGATWHARTVPCTGSNGGGASVLSIALGHPNAWLLDCFDDEQSSQEQDTQHHLFGTVNAGLSWVRLPDPTLRNEPDMLADNGAGHAFLATEGIRDTLLGTFDGGLHWSVLITSGGSFYGWSGPVFLTVRTGFVVGPTHYAPEHLYRTTDGGRRWDVVSF
jgi:photosystem II stability/assembly factor-like uncharacterized protein